MTPTTPDRPRVSARPGRLERWRASEPVLLFVYGWSLLLLTMCAASSLVTGAWWPTAVAAAVILLLFPGVWAARASVYSPTGLLRRASREDTSL
jgi:hypothetical protein